jgi:hypothetical protein
VRELQVNTVVDFLQSDTDVLAALEDVGGLFEGGLGIVCVKDFLDMFLGLVLL